MSTEMTPTQRLASVLLGRPLSEYVAEKRNARPRWPWRMIADQLAEDTNGEITVSYEALRSWYGEVAA